MTNEELGGKYQPSFINDISYEICKVEGSNHDHSTCLPNPGMTNSFGLLRSATLVSMSKSVGLVSCLTSNFDVDIKELL